MYFLVAIVSITASVYLLFLLKKYTSSDKYKFYNALLCERAGDYNKALIQYPQFFKPNQTRFNLNTLEYDAFVRYSICTLRSNDVNLISSWINDSLPIILSLPNSKSKDEIIMEYVLVLLNSKMFAPASNLLYEHLLQKDNKQLKSLKSFTEENIKNKVNKILEYVNKNLDNPSCYYDLLDQVAENKKEIKVFPDIYEKVKKIEPFILNYLINHIETENDFVKIFWAITRSDDLCNDLNLLNNAGIFAERIVSNSLLDEGNFKDVISTFISVIYNDAIFFENLRSTNWDDSLRIELDNSKGYLQSAYISEEEWDCILDSDEGREQIDIEKTRQFLLEDFETSLLKLKTDNTNLISKAIAFFNSEKEVIEGSIENIFALLDDDNIQIAFTPYFGKKHKLTSHLIKILADHEEHLSESNYDSSLPYIEILYEKEKLKSNPELIIPLLNSITGIGMIYELFKSSLAADYIIFKLSTSIENIFQSLDPIIITYLANASSADVKKIENVFFEKEKQLNLSTKKKIETLQNLINIIPRSKKIRIMLSNLLASDAIDKANKKELSPIECLNALITACAIYSDNIAAQNNIVLIFEDLSTTWAIEKDLPFLINDAAKVLSSEMKNNLRFKLFEILRNFQAYVDTETKKGIRLDVNKVFQTVNSLQRSIEVLVG